MSDHRQARWQRELAQIEEELDALIDKYQRTRRLTRAERKRARHLVMERNTFRSMASGPLSH